MANLFRLPKTRHVFVIVLGMAFIVINFSSDTAFASIRPARNDAEQAARNLCGTGTQGAIWFSSTNDFNDGGYNGGFYANGVHVPATLGAVRIYIHGSANTCLQKGNYPNRTFYAINVAGGSGPNDWRLKNLSSTVMSRGTFVGSYTAYDWTSIPSSGNGYIAADLDVDGLVPPGAVNQKITIGIYRCPSYNGRTVTGNCNTQQVDVLVTRDALPWSMSPSSTVAIQHPTGASYGAENSGTLDVNPGDTVRFSHQVKNNGPSNASSNIAVSTVISGGLGTIKTATMATPAVSTKQSLTDVFIIPTGVLPGMQYCQYVQANPASNSNSGAVSGNTVCVKVAYNYDLTPIVAVKGASTVPVDGTASFEYVITNTGTVTNLTGYIARSIYIPPGVNPPQSFFDSHTPSSGCTQYTSYGSGVTCQDLVAYHTQNKVFNTNSTNQLDDVSYPSPDPNVVTINHPIGSQLCRVLSVDSRDQTPSPPVHNRDSSVVCVTVVKKPSVHVWGGDVMVHNGGVTTSSFQMGGKIYGSWAEYAIIAPHTINSYSSGALANVAARTNAAISDTSDYLTFANTPTKGDFVSSSSVPDVAGSIRQRAIGSQTALVDTAALNRLTGGSYYVTSTDTSDLHLAAGGDVVLKSGVTVVIDQPNRTVYIDNNITYAPRQYTSAANIPQFVIIAKNIIVKANVKNVDSWLLATDTISTCDGITSPYYSGLTSATCNQPLVINGPVQASHLQLRRTAGADGGDDTSLSVPAETINQRSDSYLWATSHGSNDAIRTTYTRDVAPRL